MQKCTVYARAECSLSIALHMSSGQAWLQYCKLWIEEQISNETLNETQALENSIEAKRVLFSQGLSLPEITDAVLEEDPEPYFFSEENPLLQWTSYAAIQSVPPELNDTYSALDEYFAQGEVSPPYHNTQDAYS